MQTCSYCGRESADSFTHCGECGTPFVFAVRAEPEQIGCTHPSTPPKATFGSLSLVVFCGALLVMLYFPLTVSVRGYTGERAFGYALTGIFFGCIGCIPNLALAIIGITRQERPRWPAVTALLLSVLPALGGIYLLCGAPL